MRVVWLALAALLVLAAGLWLVAPSGPTVPATPSASPSKRAEVRTDSDSVERIDASTIRLDHRFDVTGHGSEADPYRITWPLLGSASETMSDGSAEPPRWIRLLDGSWIEISGYLSTPIVNEETREVLFTMNRWDGCCIGIPPTPFDSIEIKLAKPITLVGKHAIRFATVRGELRVEPFALGGAILGIYRLERAIVTTQAQ